MQALLPEPAAIDFAHRATSWRRELGAYEALWDRKSASFRTLATIFRAHPAALPSDFVVPCDIETYASRACRVLDGNRARGWGLRVYGLGDYPHRLRDALHPAQLIYFRGFWELVNSPCIAIVGTRQPSLEGLRRAAGLARRLAADGFTVISGLARGIDTAAHESALSVGGRTIAVLGTPITTCYPPENRSLQHRIGADHLLVSPVPIVRHGRQDVHANKRFFAERTALMSALAAATVIVEATDMSGALVQARHALAQGRKLFVLDSCFRAPSLQWPRRLAARGAIRVAEYDELRAQLDACDSRALLADRRHEPRRSFAAQLR
jgi:DNA processing protein